MAKTPAKRPPGKTTPERPPANKIATIASKALRTGKATPAQIKTMGGRIESERAAVAKKAAVKAVISKAKPKR
jgi:hypothetical protein